VNEEEAKKERQCLDGRRPNGRGNVEEDEETVGKQGLEGGERVLGAHFCSGVLAAHLFLMRQVFFSLNWS
jgi:hypothetical protein